MPPRSRRTVDVLLRDTYIAPSTNDTAQGRHVLLSIGYRLLDRRDRVAERPDDPTSIHHNPARVDDEANDCPALGPSPTVTCPLREMMLSAAKKARPEVEPETLEEEFLDTICKKHSAAFDLTEMQSPQQAFDYGTEEWETFHDHARNTVESGNDQLKASGDADIETAGRRRVRGITAAQILVTILIVNHNLRKIAAFLSDQEIERARTTPRVHTIRRRDRVWANRYTKTTGSGDLTIPRGGRTSSSTSPGSSVQDVLALTPMRT